MEGKRLAGIVLMFAFAAACGGGATTTGGASAGATAAATSATSAPTSAATATSAGAGEPALTALLAASKTSQYKITYKITATGTGTEGLSGTQTWYLKPPRSRFDFSVVQGGQSLQMSFFSLPDGQYYCFTFTGAGAQCLSVKGVGSPLDQNAAALAQRSLIDNPGQYGATFKENRTIAGQQGLCYDVKSSTTTAGFSTGTFCYTKDGIPLLSSFTVSGSTWTMEATSFSATVSDSDFTLPVKPSN